MKTTLTINLFNLIAYSLVNTGNAWKLEEYNGLKIESYSSTTERLRIRFNPGNIFGTQFVEAPDIEKRRPLNFEHLERRISVLIVDRSANKDKLLRILIENEEKFSAPVIK